MVSLAWLSAGAAILDPQLEGDRLVD